MSKLLGGAQSKSMYTVTMFAVIIDTCGTRALRAPRASRRKASFSVSPSLFLTPNQPTRQPHTSIVPYSLSSLSRLVPEINGHTDGRP